MTRLKSNTIPFIVFIVFKALSEENESVDPYVNILKNRGYDVRLIPTIGFEYHNLDELNRKLQNPQDYSGMVITSPRCARGVIKCLVGRKLKKSWLNKPIFVVGETTSRIVTRELNLEPIGADTGNAMALIPIISKYKPNEPLLAPCGNLKFAINISSVEFDNIEVYRTVPHNNLKQNLKTVLDQVKDQIGVIFFSPSGFHAILDLIPKQLFSKIHIFAIGPTTSAAIKDAGYTLTGVCEKPKPESMIDMINTFIDSTVLPK